MAIESRPSNIDRSLLQAPMDILSPEEEQLAAQEDEFLNLEVIEDDEGGAEVVFGETTEVVTEVDFFGNLADVIDDDELAGVSIYVLDSVDSDENSRSDWRDTYVKGLKLLGMRYEDRTEPFDGATGVVHPVLNEAVTQFQAGAYKELCFVFLFLQSRHLIVIVLF